MTRVMHRVLLSRTLLYKADPRTPPEILLCAARPRWLDDGADASHLSALDLRNNHYFAMSAFRSDASPTGDVQQAAAKINQSQVAGGQNAAYAAAPQISSQHDPFLSQLKGQQWPMTEPQVRDLCGKAREILVCLQYQNMC